MKYIFSYYTLMIWFPELFHRFETFEAAHPGASASVCEVSSVILDHSNGYSSLCGFLVKVLC